MIRELTQAEKHQIDEIAHRLYVAGCNGDVAANIYNIVTGDCRLVPVRAGLTATEVAEIRSNHQMIGAGG